MAPPPPRRWIKFVGIFLMYCLLTYLVAFYAALHKKKNDATESMLVPVREGQPQRRCLEEYDRAFTVMQDVGQLIRGIAERQDGRAPLQKRDRPRKLIHGMPFDCEEWMLEIKLNELAEVVDHFILVEGGFTLQNTRREQCFPRIANTNARIAPWAEKIVYIYDERPIPEFTYWEAEVYYRDLIGLEGLPRIQGGLTEDDLVVVTDVDELPDPSFLWVLKWYNGFRTPINMHMRWSYYSFGWMNTASWSVNAIVSLRDLALAGNRTNAVRLGVASWSTGPTMLVGWHCSWCLPTDRFIDKMAHFAHTELNQMRFHNVEWLEKMRQHGLWFPDAAPNGCVQSRVVLPQYVEQNMDRFKAIC